MKFPFQKIHNGAAGLEAAPNSPPCCIRCDPSGSRFDLYLSRLSGFALGQGDSQHAVLEDGCDVPRIEGVWHREAAREIAVPALDAVVAFARLLFFELALSREGQGLVFDADIDIFLIDFRQVGLEDELVLRL